MQNMWDIIHYFDIFGETLKFRLDSRGPKFKTGLGGILSIILLALIIALLIQQAQNLIFKKQPIINKTNIILNSPQNITLSKFENILFFQVFDSNGTNLIFNNFLEIDYLTLENQYFPYTTPLFSGVVSKNVNQCSKSLFYKNNHNLMSDGTICIDNLNNVSLGYNSVIFQIRICTNSTNNNFSCRSSSDIISKLNQGIFLNLSYLNLEVDETNYSEPYQTYLVNQLFKLSPNIVFNMNIYYSYFNISTDQGFLFESIYKDSSLYIDSTSVLIDYSTNQTSLFNFQVNSSKKSIYMSRYYMKIQNLAALIGGALKLMTVIGVLLSKSFTQYKMMLRVSNNLFNFDTQETMFLIAKRKSNTEDIIVGAEKLLQIKKESIAKKRMTNFKENNVNKSPNIDFSSIKNDSIFINKINLNNFQNLDENFTKSLNPENSKKINLIRDEHFTKIVNQRKLKLCEIQLSYVDIFLLFFCKVCSNKHKKIGQLVNFAQSEIGKFLNITHYIRFLREIMKLKIILFSQEQIKIFNEGNKATIDESGIVEDPAQTIKQRKINLTDLFESYIAISKNTNVLNQKLIENFDENFKIEFDQIIQEQKFSMYSERI